MGGEEFTLYSNGYFIVPKERAITEYMSEDIKESVNSLTPNAIQLLQTFSAIFCSENEDYGKVGDNQVVYFGYVTDISVQDNGIKIHYLTIKQIPQNIFNENLDEFILCGTTSFNELNRTHWCVKRNNF